MNVNHEPGRQYTDDELRQLEKHRAGCRKLSYAENGRLVGVYEAARADIDADTRWVVLCEDHAAILEEPTLTQALADRHDPAEWCEDCRDHHEPSEATA